MQTETGECPVFGHSCAAAREHVISCLSQLNIPLKSGVLRLAQQRLGSLSDLLLALLAGREAEVTRVAVHVAAPRLVPYAAKLRKVVVPYILTVRFPTRLRLERREGLLRAVDTPCVRDIVVMRRKCFGRLQVVARQPVQHVEWLVRRLARQRLRVARVR